jgi:outer membrane receptor for ferrienterochelin and colicin
MRKVSRTRPHQNHGVANYSVWDVNGSWSMTKAFSILGSARNVA